MEHDFWIERWSEGRIGFHRGEPDPALVRHADRWLGAATRHRVLVPLCGKSVDLVWLADRGHDVVGVELAEQAVADFHLEQGRSPRVERVPPFTAHHSRGLTVLQGDWFEATPERLGSFDRVWDRAALVAMPPALRPRYVEVLRALVEPGGSILQSAFTYDQSKMPGPPFSVPEGEVRALYAGARVEVLHHDEREPEPRWRERGLTWWADTDYLISL